MSVEIQSVLALLPQILPGEQEIPLGRIRPNPANPGPPISEKEIAEMVESVEAVGLENPIKVMPDQANPFAPGVSPHPEDPKLRADNRPWEPGDFNWVILAGELRWRAFDRLKRGSIPAYVRNPAGLMNGQIKESTALLQRLY